METDPLIGPKLKIERANRDIKDFAPAIHDFAKANAHKVTFFVEPDPDGINQWFKAKVDLGMPVNAAAIAGGVVGNLRDALDQIACALARKNGATSTNGTYFPVAGDLNEFELPATQRKIKKLHPDAQTLIRSMKPYLGGNDLLWALNRLKNTDAHVELVFIGMMSLGARTAITMRPTGIGLMTFSAPKWVRIEEDKTLKLLQTPVGETANQETELALDVAFSNVQVLAGIPAIICMQQMMDLVQGFLLTVEKRFFV